MNCVFCKIVAQELNALKILEDNHHIAILDINPIQKGHVLVIPKSHSEFLWDMLEEEQDNLHKFTRKVKDKIIEIYHPKTVGMAVEGLSVPHTHIHLMPINSSDELDPCLAKSMSHDELKIVYEQFINN